MLRLILTLYVLCFKTYNSNFPPSLLFLPLWNDKGA